MQRLEYQVMKRLTKTLDQGAQNYMFTRKINYVWIINLVLFAGVVFLGIEQAGRGAEISNLENKLEVVSIEKEIYLKIYLTQVVKII